MVALAELLSAAEARNDALLAKKESTQADADALDATIAAKRAEKSIAAMNEVKELMKKKESMQKEVKTIAAACALVEKAVAKLNGAKKMGLSDWASVHESKVKPSEFALKRLQSDPKALETLRKAVPGASISFADKEIAFAGSKDDLPKLNDALTALEGDYEEVVEADDEDTVALLENRGEFSSLAKRKGVTITRQGTSIRVSGPPAAAQAAVTTVKGILSGKADMDCPKQLFGAAKAVAKDVEAETGALIEVWKTGGWNGGGMIYIRGIDDCVEQAREQIQTWLDEKEGAYSELVDISKDTKEWEAKDVDQFCNDLQMMSQKFGIAAKPQTAPGKFELRGPHAAVEPALKEFHMIVDFYRQASLKAKAQQAHAAKSKQKAEEAKKKQEEEEDDWGAAPTAEPTPMSW
eukprot:TRINITY_DN17203_c0_g1_i1.p1 TRINITY_DN17203_c0_g1~~TRINITY_DN17203_c0_g1_i1.p1  ORF type:complete len:408 (+),score=179.97 TRINITY_DN17203_c0_g1_i1:93-1316(+)